MFILSLVECVGRFMSHYSDYLLDRRNVGALDIQ